MLVSLVISSCDFSVACLLLLDHQLIGHWLITTPEYTIICSYLNLISLSVLFNNPSPHFTPLSPSPVHFTPLPSYNQPLPGLTISPFYWKVSGCLSLLKPPSQVANTQIRIMTAWIRATPPSFSSLTVHALTFELGSEQLHVLLQLRQKAFLSHQVTHEIREFPLTDEQWAVPKIKSNHTH